MLTNKEVHKKEEGRKVEKERDKIRNKRKKKKGERRNPTLSSQRKE